MIQTTVYQKEMWCTECDSYTLHHLCKMSQTDKTVTIKYSCDKHDQQALKHEKTIDRGIYILIMANLLKPNPR